MSKATVNGLINEINAVDQQTLHGDADARLKLLAAAQALCIRLETPFDFVQRVAWQEPSFLMCLKIADDINLFAHIGAEGSTPKRIEDLAEATHVETELLKRISRHLAARHVLVACESSAAPPGSSSSGTSLGSYAATHISTALATREASSGIRQACSLYYPNFLAMPDFLRERGYKTPTDNRDGPFQRRVGMVGSTSFECQQLPEHRAVAEDFNLLMAFTTKGRRSFLDVCDVGELLRSRPYLPAASQAGTDGGNISHGSSSTTAESDGGNYLFVDVGGGTGTDARAFRARFPDAAGKVELQELPAVIRAAEARATAVAAATTEQTDAGGDTDKILFRAHDFFTEQPVQGSRFFFMGSVLHDWPDVDAARILRRLAAAMRPGYSTLLLSENVLTDSIGTGSASGVADGGTGAGDGIVQPGRGSHPHLSAIDLTMMTSLASKERSERDWAELIGSAGLKIVKVHTVPSSLKSVIECDLSA